MNERRAIDSAQQAANDERVLLVGRLLGAANALEHLLSRALETESGIDHQTFEVLLVLGRAGAPGLPLRDIAQARVLTSGGVTRLVRRIEARGLVRQAVNPADGRSRLISLTATGEAVVTHAARRHAEHVERLVLEHIPVDERGAFAQSVRRLSIAARAALPTMS